MNFAEKLKKLRKEKKLSQAEIAKKLDVSIRTVQNYELGKSYPRNRENYQILANLLDCDVNYLLTENTEFLTDAQNQYGSRGKKQAAALIEDITGCFAGGELSEEDMDEMMQAIQDAYWIAKKNNRKYIPKKYQKDN